MLDRLLSGYRYRLRLLLELAGVERAETRAQAIAAGARADCDTSGTPIEACLDRVCRTLREEAVRTLAASGVPSLLAGLRQRAEFAGGGLAEPLTLYCDGSLVGLARWLRAGGQDARARRGARARDLIAEALRMLGLLLTTDHSILAFGAVRDGRLPTLWIPSSLPTVQQARMAVVELGLTRRESRCMACGGALAVVQKHDVQERIPPRTAQWLSSYAACEQCGRLYWPGTHWARIERLLDRIFSSAPSDWGWCHPSGVSSTPTK